MGNHLVLPNQSYSSISLTEQLRSWSKEKEKNPITLSLKCLLSRTPSLLKRQRRIKNTTPTPTLLVNLKEDYIKNIFDYNRLSAFKDFATIPQKS